VAAAAGILPAAADPEDPGVEIAFRAAQDVAARDRVGPVVVVSVEDDRVDVRIRTKGDHAAIALVKRSGNEVPSRPSQTSSTRMIRS
jgi:hypothetical protein